MLTPPEFEHYLRTEVGLNDAQLQDFERQTMKSVAYAMAASRDKFIKKKGMFQLLGVSIFIFLINIMYIVARIAEL
jgi:hypothetical protein